MAGDTKKRIIEVKVVGADNSKVDLEKVRKAEENYNKAISATGQAIRKINKDKRDAVKIQRLNIQLTNAEEGSYEQLSAQLGLNTIELNKMSRAQRENTKSGKELVASTFKIKQEMISIKEAQANYTLSVGHYEKGMKGLNNATSQIVRELPAASVGLSTFFLGISNNIPMLVDQINNLKAANIQLAKSGKEQVNIFKAVGKSLLSWNSVIMITITAVTMFGKEIGEFFKKMAGVNTLTKEQIKEQKKLTKAMNKHYTDSAENISKMDMLYKASNNVNNSMSDRIKAAQKLIDMHPRYFKNTTAEQIAVGKAADAYGRLKDRMKEAAKAKALQEVISVNYKEIVDIESKKIEEQSKIFVMRQKLIEPIPFNMGISAKKREAELKSIENEISDSESRIRDLDKKKSELLADIENISNRINVSDLLFDSKTKTSKAYTEENEDESTSDGVYTEKQLQEIEDSENKVNEIKMQKRKELEDWNRVYEAENREEKEIEKAEIEQENFEAEIEKLDISIQEKNNLIAESEEKLQERIAMIRDKYQKKEDAKAAKKEAKDKKDREKELLRKQKVLQQGLDAFVAITDQETLVGKSASIARATINTYQGVTEVWRTPSKLPEPFATMSKIANTAIVVTSGLQAVNKIKAQTFEHGGIVDGTSYTGDNVQVYANSGEMFINRQQQSKLFGMLNGQAQSSDIDSDKIAEAVVSAIKSIPVVVSEQEITEMQAKVKVREQDFEY